MKRCTVLTLLLLFLFSSTELHEFLKIPMLLEHFTEHKQENTALSFWDFISNHYAEPTHSEQALQDRDKDKHTHLPFKSHSDFCMNVFVADIPSTYFYPVPCLSSFPLDFTLFRKSFFQSSTFLNIWQPPKLS